MDTSFKLSSQKALDWCLNLIFPKHCLGCGQEKSYLCPPCFESLRPMPSTSCFICGRRSPAGYACPNCARQYSLKLSGILVAADWNSLLLRQIIYEYKYRFIKELAEPLGKLMISFLEINTPPSWSEKQENELIFIPVPLHGRRLAWRGFNQSELLAQKIAPHFNASLANRILIRSRHTLPQQKMADKKTRSQNIQNAFSLSPKIKLKNNLLKNNIIILVDDISTTGATLQDCARTLQELKPKEIWGLVIARG